MVISSVCRQQEYGFQMAKRVKGNSWENHVAVDAQRFLLKTTLIQLRCQVVNSCNPGSEGRAALMFFVVIFTAGDKSSKKGKLKANQIFFFSSIFLL